METASINKVLQLFNMLSKSDQLKIADKIGQQTFKERWKLVDESMPDSEYNDDEIMDEVRAIRYNGKI